MTAQPLLECILYCQEQLDIQYKNALYRYPDLDAQLLRTFFTNAVSSTALSTECYDFIIANPNLFAEIFNYAVELTGRGLLREQRMLHTMQTAWSKLIPLLILNYRENVLPVIRDLTNAVYVFTQYQKNNHILWIELIASNLASSSYQSFRCLLQLCAWRCGCAFLRHTAIDAIRYLENKSVMNILQIETLMSSESLVLNLSKDPWWFGIRDRERLQFKYMAGGFSGFGGLFKSPPKVWSSKDGIVAQDESSSFLIHADCYGVTLTPCYDEGEPVVNQKKYTPDTSLFYREADAIHIDKNTITSQAYDESKLAITCSDSHFVFIFALG